MPGRIITAHQAGGQLNPLILLDEVDKLTTDCRAATRPARCSRCSTPSRTTQFRDHYHRSALWILSEVPLHRHRQHRRDHPRAAAGPDGGHRDGQLHSDDEKLSHRQSTILISKQLKRHGLTRRNLSFTDERAAEDHPTATPGRPGVRSLEREHRLGLPQGRAGTSSRTGTKTHRVDRIGQSADAALGRRNF